MIGPLSFPLLSLALATPAGAAELVQQGLLVCPDSATCEEDRTWLQSIGGGGPGGFSVLDFEEEFAPDALPDGLSGREQFMAALDDTRTAVGKGRWPAAMAASDRAIAALAEWNGLVKRDALFELWYLRGVAGYEKGGDSSYAYSFRQALAVADGATLATPAVRSEVEQAFLDEQRKLVVDGKGELVLSGGPEGVRWWVDGGSIEASTGADGASITVPLWPGNHRVTATAPGYVRSWTAEVPVVAERISAVQPTFVATDEATRVFRALDQAVETLEVSDDVADLLVAWCEEHDVDELRLLRVREVREKPRPVPVALSEAPATRPEAAAGEKVDMGDGVPTTFEGEVLQRHAAAGEAHVQRIHRLRVVFFDPATRHFSPDPMVSTALQQPPEKLRLGVRTTGVSMMDRLHLGVDLQLSVPVGPIDAEARLGFVRADSPYNLYTDWVDHTLPHLWLGARIAPDWSVAPFAAAGLELFAPAAVGGRAEAGIAFRFDQDWRADVDFGVGLLDRGLQLGGGLGLTRGF